MRVSCCLCSLAALAIGLAIPGDVCAQNYFQDFSATFPSVEPGDAGLLTILLTNEDGDTIAPYVDFEVPGLGVYAGRPQFGARTGGANANQEVSGPTVTYTLGAADTVVSYPVDPFPATGGNGNYEPGDGFDPGFILLSEDGIGGIQSAVAWDEAFNGDYDVARHEFAFRISGIGDAANDQADGIGWSYLNSENYGTTGVTGPGISEEPNYTGSLGVGFDIYDNGGEGGNSISVHFDGRVLESITIDPGTIDPNTGEEWAFNTFEDDTIVSASIIVTPGSGAGVASPELKGGSPYSVWNRGGRPPELIQVGGEGSMEGYLRVAEEATGVANVVAFDWDGSTPAAETVASFNFRALNENANRADGISFLLVPTELYEETGATLIAFGPHEEPNLAGALGVGFDTFNDDIAAQDDPEGMANVGNHVSVHFDGAKLSQENYDLVDDFDIQTDDPDVWHKAEIFVSGDNLTVIVTDGVDGSVHVAYDGAVDGLGDIGIVRPAFAARTGGAFDHYEIDNFIYRDAAAGVQGDYNANGLLDAGDLDLQSQAIKDNDLAFDENNDGVVDVADRKLWVNDYKNTWMGDADLNGQFNSSDFVLVFTEGKYETGEMAGWAAGDWDGDMDFDSSDFVAAFSDGGYEMGEKAGGPNPATAAVPEPSALALFGIGLLLIARVRRK